MAALLLTLLLPLQAFAQPPGPAIRVSPNSGPVGTPVVIFGTGWDPRFELDVRWNCGWATTERRPIAKVETNNKGGWVARANVPADCRTQGSEVWVEALGGSGGSPAGVFNITGKGKDQVPGLLNPDDLWSITYKYIWQTPLKDFVKLQKEAPLKEEQGRGEPYYLPQLSWETSKPHICSFPDELRGVKNIGKDPDKPYNKFDFSDACRRHDFAWENLKRQNRLHLEVPGGIIERELLAPERTLMNARFQQDMLDICEQVKDQDNRSLCTNTAREYYTAVEVGGPAWPHIENLIRQTERAVGDVEKARRSTLEEAGRLYAEAIEKPLAGLMKNLDKSAQLTNGQLQEEIEQTGRRIQKGSRDEIKELKKL